MGSSLHMCFTTVTSRDSSETKHVHRIRKHLPQSTLTATTGHEHCISLDADETHSFSSHGWIFARRVDPITNNYYKQNSGGNTDPWMQKQHESDWCTDLLAKSRYKLCSRSSAFPVGRARFTSKFNQISRVFIIWVHDSVASAMLMRLPARENTV